MGEVNFLNQPLFVLLFLLQLPVLGVDVRLAGLQLGDQSLVGLESSSYLLNQLLVALAHPLKPLL